MKILWKSGALCSCICLSLLQLNESLTCHTIFILQEKHFTTTVSHISKWIYIGISPYLCWWSHIVLSVCIYLQEKLSKPCGRDSDNHHLSTAKTNPSFAKIDLQDTRFVSYSGLYSVMSPVQDASPSGLSSPEKPEFSKLLGPPCPVSQAPYIWWFL